MAEKKLNSEQLEAMTDALEGGRKIEAIKIYREATGEGLKDSKEFVEHLSPGDGRR